MAEKMTYGVGAHEPIFHRLRTGNSTAEEWERWRYETSTENLDVLEKLGVGKAMLPCTKGFGLEYEKPLIERAAKFCQQASRRGIRTSIYVQGFPVYYETFLAELPQAEAWMARQQNGDYIPWGGQTFRRWIDPTVREFWEYQKRVLTYVLSQLTPCDVGMDNITLLPSYTASSRESFRQYLRDRYQGEEPLRQFGIPNFDAVDLPHFDPVYWPPDAYKIVKDPLLQEWMRWRSWNTAEFCQEMRELVHRLAPGVRYRVAGCADLRYNGLDNEDRIRVTDRCGMEESFWRPGVIESKPTGLKIVMDERHPDEAAAREKTQLRVSTDARWWKIYTNYGGSGHYGFWGETDRASKLVALSHNFAFGDKPQHLGTILPLAAAPNMLDDIRDAIDWGNAHMGALAGRGVRIAPIAVWRGTSTIGFIRHTPVWEACAVEQMLFESHLPFTILLDGGLEKFLANRQLLLLPGTQCVSDRQIRIITDFVEKGGRLLLLGAAGTRDERTRLRRKYAFAHLFGSAVPNLEYFGPPHWVPELNWSAMPPRLEVAYGAGKVALVKAITPRAPLDLTRDPYMPERQVMVKDILPPANEQEIMTALHGLLGAPAAKGKSAKSAKTAPLTTLPSVQGPRWTLCEYWTHGEDMLICLANLWKGHDGGPATIHLGPYAAKAKTATIHMLLEAKAKPVKIVNGTIRIPKLKHFAAVEVSGAL
jgi:hypothetical protein